MAMKSSQLQGSVRAMMPPTEFQKLVGLIRTRSELAPLRHVPLDRLRAAVNDIAGADIPEGATEDVAREMRGALEGWLRRPATPFVPASAPHRPRVPERACDAAPRARVVAAACQTPMARADRRNNGAALVPGKPGAEREAVHAVVRRRPAWRLLLPAFWLAFVGGVALVFVAAGWSPAVAADLLALAAVEVGRRAVAGDALGLGVGLALAGLAGIIVTNLWALLRPTGRRPA